MTQPDPPLVWAEPPPRPPTPERPGGRPRAWMLVLTVAWVVLLAGGIAWAQWHPDPTDREQTTVAQARPVADAAAVAVARAAVADDQAVAVVAGFDKVGDCKVDLVRAGERYRRLVTVLVRPGTEESLLRRIAARLPAGYHASVEHGPTLYADGGLFVRVVGTVAGPGRVRFVADTGDCRPTGDLAALHDPDDSTDAARTALLPVLSRLSLAPVTWGSYQVACPGGGAMSTVEAVGPDESGVGRDLGRVLSGPGAPVISSPEVFAYRDGPLAIAARTEDNRVVVTATHDCPQ